MKNRYLIVGLVLLVFFVISFLTNILGAINPNIKESFNLEFSSMGFMTLAFFSAYGIMSIPAGILVEKYKEKKIILSGFILACTGSFSFAIFPTYGLFLFSLFLIGTGMAMLQVAINPLLREAGGKENFAFYSVLGQLFFGVAGVVGPYLFVYLMEHLGDKSTSDKFILFLSGFVSENMSWVVIYWIFAAVAFIMVVVVLFVNFPNVELEDNEKIGGLEVFKNLTKNRTVIAFFIGIFCYVGFEQGVSFWISQFLEVYHKVDSETTGAAVVGNFWGFLTVGCFLGLVILKFLDSKKVLIIFSFFAFLSLTLALFGNKQMAILSFPAVGFFASIMWSVIFSLALNSVDKYHGSFAGILCTGIVGGAIVPFIIGGLSEVLDLRFGMIFNYMTLAYIFSIGIWAKPLVNNKTIGSK
ncbi:MFS transporter [Tamlana fucoidanivorans]|uniref:Sugar MFS transporter n=1 Tax=Allotamlana fucoidanivorans TaxID=2583814 RepID=A0A5C4SPH9_9FLAO|nr:MFS transporter [Tamlana fucoidanivorans]TNJ46040.1 sugar MFS transporter [Tamlana fucoidanivorans]